MRKAILFTCVAVLTIQGIDIANSDPVRSDESYYLEYECSTEQTSRYVELESSVYIPETTTCAPKPKQAKKRKKKKQKKENCTTSVEVEVTSIYTSDESVLTARSGVNYNKDGIKETYYNLNMSGVISIMRNAGFSESDYPYWIRDDGVKMFGSYVIVAADLSIHPRGSTVHTSLGEGIVCDTGSFVYSNNRQFDIAVNW